VEVIAMGTRNEQRREETQQLYHMVISKARAIFGSSQLEMNFTSSVQNPGQESCYETSPDDRNSIQ
jgi:hypothetical protein